MVVREGMVVDRETAALVLRCELSELAEIVELGGLRTGGTDREWVVLASLLDLFSHREFARVRGIVAGKVREVRYGG